MTKYLSVGGLVAAGFDRSGRYLLTISHSGRGVFSTETWDRVARDYNDAFPEYGIDFGIGIGPIDGEKIPITLMDLDRDELRLTSADGRARLFYESGTIEVIVLDP